MTNTELKRVLVATRAGLIRVLRAYAKESDAVPDVMKSDYLIAILVLDGIDDALKASIQKLDELE